MNPNETESEVDIITLATAILAVLMLIALVVLAIMGKKDETLNYGFVAAIGFFFGNSRGVDSNRRLASSRLENTRAINNLSDTLQNGPKKATEKLAQAVKENTEVMKIVTQVPEEQVHERLNQNGDS